MLLLGELGDAVPLQLNLQFNADLRHARYAALVAEISGTQSAESNETLPNGKTFSQPPAAMDLQSREDNLQK